MNCVIEEKLETEVPVVEGFGSVMNGFWGCGGLSYCISFMLAIFLMFKCKRNFSWIGLIVAMFCPCCYLLYIAISEKGFCSGYVRGVKPHYTYPRN